MTSDPFPLPMAARARGAQSGSAMVTALLTVFVLSLIAANVLSSISSRYNSAYRSAAWNEALLTADSGIDITLAEVARQIPDVTVSSVTGLGLGYTQDHSLPAISLLQFSNGVLPTDTSLLNLSPKDLTHAGEGANLQHIDLSLDVVPLTTLLKGGVSGTLKTITGVLSGGELQILRIRSTGTVQLTGGRVAGPSRLDNDLWRPSLMMDRLTGTALAVPTVSRQVEVLLRPVHPYEAAVVSDDVVLAKRDGTVFDSFNSLLGTASTGRQYDSLKRLSHGSVRANGSDFQVGGIVYGDVGTNGGTVKQDSHVTGIVSNASYVPLPLVNAPTWNGTVFSTYADGATTTVFAGTTVFPARSRLGAVTGTLHITGPGNYAEVYVDGNVTGSIVVDSGIAVKVYVSGSVATNASQLQNGSGLAASLQIYGVYKTAASTPAIRLNMDAALAAAIYAPGHKVYLDGKGDFSGAIVGSRFEASDAVRVHYDEALAYNAGPLLRYQIASWREIVN